MVKLIDILREILVEEKKKADRCLRIARRKYDKPSAYRSGAVVKCRQGKIWKDIKEGSEEEAWELVLSPNSNIKKTIQQAGLSDKEEDIKKVTSLIDSTKIIPISPSQIAKLKNFNNKPGEESLINDMISVSKSKNPRQSYTDYMKKRDERENRNRGYDPVQNFDNVVKGSYEPPVLINLDGSLYVIGGRTRLYAGLAANKNMNVKIIDISQLNEAKKETLRTWFKRKGATGKVGGWVDCNTCRKDPKTGRKKCKPCGRKKGETRAKYPSCRPTPSQCSDPGKGKKWGKTKENLNEMSLKQGLLAAGITLSSILGTPDTSKAAAPISISQNVAKSTIEKVVKGFEKEGYKIDFLEKAKFKNFEGVSEDDIKIELINSKIESAARLVMNEFIRVNKVDRTKTLFMANPNENKYVVIYIK